MTDVWLRRVLLVGAIAAIVAVPAWSTAVATAADQPASPARTAAAPPGDPAHGQQLYVTTCTTCHGAGMEGGIGPKLNPIQNLGNTKDPLDPGYLEQVIATGLRGAGGFSAAMPARGGNTSLTDQDVKDLAAYIIQQNHSQGSTTLDPVALARSNVFWVTLTIILLVVVTWLLSRYNMRWIARRAAGRR